MALSPPTLRRADSTLSAHRGERAALSPLIEERGRHTFRPLRRGVDTLPPRRGEERGLDQRRAVSGGALTPPPGRWSEGGGGTPGRPPAASPPRAGHTSMPGQSLREVFVRTMEWLHCLGAQLQAQGILCAARTRPKGHCRSHWRRGFRPRAAGRNGCCAGPEGRERPRAEPKLRVLQRPAHPVIGGAGELCQRRQKPRQTFP